MNSLDGHITAIEVSGNLSLVSVTLMDTSIWETIIVETPQTVPYLIKGHTIKMIFKETEVILGTHGHHSISLQNRISGRITHIEKGNLISKVTLSTKAGKVVSIIGTKALEELGLKKETTITAMVKLNEIMLSE